MEARTLANRIRVVIGEDSYLIREALEKIVSTFDHIDAVAFCDDQDSLMAAIEQERPDAVLTDIRMPPTGVDEGIQVARDLAVEYPEIGVVLLSQFVEPSYVLAFFESGTAGRAYLLKERLGDAGQLATAIEAVVSGGSAIDPKVVEVLVRARSSGMRAPLGALTQREQEVLAEIAKGKSNAAIAQELVLTKRAVEKHINSIFTKLELESPDDVSRRVMAVLLFLASGKTQASADR